MHPGNIVPGVLLLHVRLFGVCGNIILDIIEIGTCIDETEDCQEMAANEQCYTDSNVNQNANYCLRSCGMCGQYNIYQYTLVYCTLVFQEY